LGQSGALEQVEAERQEGSAAPVGEKAEVADAYEAAREQVEEEAAQELIDGQGHEVDPTLTLVAKSLYAELESCEVGAASLGDGGSVFPGSDAQQVDGCCGNDMLQVGFGSPR
jgi:hypothetical protein